MTYGCIGEHLPPSLSREIHGLLGDEPYELMKIAPEDLDAFLAARTFRAIEVRGSYRQAVIPHLDWISEPARASGVVNTIVHRDGQLRGYNTDFDGLTRLVARMGLDLRGAKVLILGAGDMSRTAAHVAQALGAEAIRDPADADFIVNTMPCGISSREAPPLDLAAFPRLRGVIDTCEFPLRSRLVLAARARGIPAAGGLYLRVAQALRTAELFWDTTYPIERVEAIYGRLCREKENVVLIGMPDSGKSTVAGILGQMLGRPVANVDDLIIRRAGMPIVEIFARYGEPYFRNLESEIAEELAACGGQVIATGGGTILRPANVTALRQNGRLFLLDRPLERLMPSAERPLADNREKIERLYWERMPLYRAAADEIIASTDTAEDAARRIANRVGER